MPAPFWREGFFNIVDTALVGRFVGNDALAAVGSTSFIFMLLLSFITGLANGGGIIIAQYFGSRNYRGLQFILICMALTVDALTIILSAGGVFLSGTLLRFLETPEDIFSRAHGYIRLLTGFCFTTMLYNASSTLLRSMGNSRIPLYALLAASLCNILLDLHFILVFGLGVRGAALGLIIYTMKEKLLSLFIDPLANPLSTEMGIPYLSIIGIAYVMAGIMRSYLRLIRGAGDVNISFLAGIVELITRVALSHLLVIPLGFTGIFIANPLSWGLGSVAPVVRYYSGRWRERSFVPSGAPA